LKNVIRIGVLFCIAYFLLGLIAVHFNILNQDDYNRYASVVGGLASIFGLLAFTQPRLTTSDLRQVEIDALRQVSQAVGELKQREGELAESGKQLNDLELRKAEMKLIAKKVSLVQFLKDKRERFQEELVLLVNNNSSIKTLINDIRQIEQKLLEINEELDGHEEEIKLILDAIDEAEAHDRYSKLNLKERQALSLGLSIHQFVESLARRLDRLK